MVLINSDKHDKPVKTFCAWTSAPSVIRWNPTTQQIATSHDNEVRIWDTRKDGSYSLFITAHSKSISSLDWSPNRTQELVTCGEDSLIKV